MKIFKINSTIIISLIMIICLAFFTACEEEGPSFREFNYPVPEVTSISPIVGFPNQEIKITGSNFGEVGGPVKIYFNGVETSATDIISVTDNEIIAKIPQEALSGPVSLTIWTHVLSSVGTFNVLPLPKILSVISQGITDNIAEPGDEVWINGVNFLTDESLVAVDFNGTPAAIVSLTEDQIKVTAPSGYTAGPVNVTLNSDFVLEGTALSPGIEPGDVSLIFLKNFEQPFSTDNMTPEQGFNGSNWGTPDFWNVNTESQNQINGGASKRCGGANYGKSGMKNIGELCFQAGWSDAIGNVLNNGKMYQTANLPAGSYKLEIEIMESGFKNYGSQSAVYVMVATGSTLPDLVSPDTAPSPALAVDIIPNGVGYGNKVVQTIEFTLTEPTQVSMGFVASMVSNSYLRMNYMRLILL